MAPWPFLRSSPNRSPRLSPSSDYSASPSQSSSFPASSFAGLKSPIRLSKPARAPIDLPWIRCRSSACAVDVHCEMHSRPYIFSLRGCPFPSMSRTLQFHRVAACFYGCLYRRQHEEVQHTRSCDVRRAFFASERQTRLRKRSVVAKEVLFLWFDGKGWQDTCGRDLRHRWPAQEHETSPLPGIHSSNRPHHIPHSAKGRQASRASAHWRNGGFSDPQGQTPPSRD